MHVGKTGSRYLLVQHYDWYFLVREVERGEGIVNRGRKIAEVSRGKKNK